MEVTQSANIVADELAGPSNPDPHPNPTPYTKKHNKYLKYSFFSFFDSIIFTKGPADYDEWTKPPIELCIWI